VQIARLGGGAVAGLADRLLLEVDDLDRLAGGQDDAPDVVVGVGIVRHECLWRRHRHCAPPT
jgi:hypothetical protein